MLLKQLFNLLEYENYKACTIYSIFPSVAVGPLSQIADIVGKFANSHQFKVQQGSDMPTFYLNYICSS